MQLIEFIQFAHSSVFKDLHCKSGFEYVKSFNSKNMVQTGNNDPEMKSKLSPKISNI